jgi:methylthioribose-1-phosphate isomerase
MSETASLSADPAGTIRTLEWQGDAATGQLILIDQTHLPCEQLLKACGTVEEVWEAIRVLRVRGAPAIGVAAAYGCVLGARDPEATTAAGSFACLKSAGQYLRTSRPTAVNLFWAIDRMERAGGAALELDRSAFLERLLVEAHAISEEDRAMCRAIGRHGAAGIRPGDGILTHCNAGGLATADYGTALACIFTAHENGVPLRVFVDETRPLLQGARLTAWELQQRQIPLTLICDSMAAQVMREGRIQRVIVGADRIAANGDTANKIGTYGVAVLARAHQIPFYVAAPSSTFDLSIPDGSHIPIEQRDPREITHGFGLATAPAEIEVYNPAFDVTPASLITGIITEYGLIQPVNTKAIRLRLAVE